VAPAPPPFAPAPHVVVAGAAHTPSGLSLGRSAADIVGALAQLAAPDGDQDDDPLALVLAWLWDLVLGGGADALPRHPFFDAFRALPPDEQRSVLYQLNDGLAQEYARRPAWHVPIYLAIADTRWRAERAQRGPWIPIGELLRQIDACAAGLPMPEGRVELSPRAAADVRDEAARYAAAGLTGPFLAALCATLGSLQGGELMPLQHRTGVRRAAMQSFPHYVYFCDRSDVVALLPRFRTLTGPRPAPFPAHAGARAERLVHADSLLEGGDERGELIVLDERDREVELGAAELERLLVLAAKHGFPRPGGDPDEAIASTCSPAGWPWSHELQLLGETYELRHRDGELSLGRRDDPSSWQRTWVLSQPAATALERADTMSPRELNAVLTLVIDALREGRIESLRLTPELVRATAHRVGPLPRFGLPQAFAREHGLEGGYSLQARDRDRWLALWARLRLIQLHAR
jgi:hypothetical protein